MDAAASRGEVPSPSPSPSVRFMNEKAAGIRKSLSVYVLCPLSALLLSLPSSLHCCYHISSHDSKSSIVGLNKRTSDLLHPLPHPLLLLLTLASETRNCGYVHLLSSFFCHLYLLLATILTHPLYSSFSFYSSLISYQLTTTKEMHEEVVALRRGTPLSIPRFSCPSPLHLYFFPLSPLSSAFCPLPSPLYAFSSPLSLSLSPSPPLCPSPLSLSLSPISPLPSPPPPPSPLPSPPSSFHSFFRQ